MSHLWNIKTIVFDASFVLLNNINKIWSRLHHSKGKNFCRDAEGNNRSVWLHGTMDHWKATILSLCHVQVTEGWEYYNCPLQSFTATIARTER